MQELQDNQNEDDSASIHVDEGNTPKDFANYNGDDEEGEIY